MKLLANLKSLLQRKAFVLSAVLMTLLLSSGQVNAKTINIYQQGNNPANYIRVVKAKGKDMSPPFNQPYQLSEDKLADILRSILYNRRALFGDKIKTRVVFAEDTIDKYTPYLIEAFQKAGPNQAVYFSVAQNYTKVVLRNPYLTQVAMWIVGDELYMRFDKTHAKLLGDYQARTPEGKKMRENAVGLRISLDAGPGQRFFADSARGLIMDLGADWEAIATQVAAEQERIRQEKELAKAKGSKKKKLEKKYQKEEPIPQAASLKDQKNAETRLLELKRLKDMGLISAEDYDIKKAEILRDL